MPFKSCLKICLFLAITTACKDQAKDDSSNSASDDNAAANDASGMISVAKTKDLPSCTKALEAQVIYVKEELGFVVCKDKKWETVDLRSEVGPQGERGASGVISTSISAQWRSVWENNVRSVAFVYAEYARGVCSQAEAGSGFIVGSDLVATNGHVVSKTLTPSNPSLCGGDLDLVRVRLWFPVSVNGDTQHATRGADAVVTKVDFSIAHKSDIVLLQASTGSRTKVTVTNLDFASDTINGAGIKIADEVVQIGYSGATTFAHFAPGHINQIQRTGTASAGFLAPLIADGLIEAGTTVLEYDLVSGSGSSGGPVFSLNGEAIGINFAGNTEAADTEFGYAIPAKALREFIAQTRVWENP